jgi:hypothetical protein
MRSPPLQCKGAGHSLNLHRLTPDPLEVWPQRLTQRGKPDPRFTFKQESAKLVFQAPDRVRQRRLRNVTKLRRAGEMFYLAKREEIADVDHFHIADSEIYGGAVTFVSAIFGIEAGARCCDVNVWSTAMT